MTISDKVAIVSGASRGIGLCVAAALAQEGSRVFAISRSAPPESGEGVRLRAIPADVRSRADVERAVGQVLEEAGTIDILVNNAGVEFFKPLGQTSETEYELMVDTNLRGAFLLTRAVLPTLRAHHSGHLVFINSVSGLRGFSQDAVYSASKHALLGLADSLEEELRPEGIRVTSIFPGATDTALPAASWSPIDDPRRTYFLQPDDVAAAVSYALKQPQRVAVSRVVLRPMIEPPYSDFLSVDLARRLSEGSPDLSGE
jgi:NAD(P)-dependent dehydrogenase (short-subunit alcohol dehydrogenase family)